MRSNPTLMCGLLLTAVCIGACQQSNTTAMVWQDPVYRDLQYKKIMVIALTDETERVRLEEFVANRLKSRHLNATPSSNVIRSLDRIDFSEFANFARADKIEAVITISPFTAEAVVSETDWEVETDRELGDFLVERKTIEIVGDYGVEVIIWHTKDWRPFWVGRSEVFVEATETTEVADFVADSIRQHDAL